MKKAWDGDKEKSPLEVVDISKRFLFSLIVFVVHIGLYFLIGNLAFITFFIIYFGVGLYLFTFVWPEDKKKKQRLFK